MYDELIKQLRRCASYDPRFVIQDCEDAADAIEDLEKCLAIALLEYQRANNKLLMTEEYAKQKNRWIPVTERLPNCNGCYLVWRPHFFGGEIGMPSICYFDGSNTWHDSYGVDFERILHPKDVSHWMPLPQPPKDGNMSIKIKRFKLKENADVSSIPFQEHMTYVHKDAVRGFFKTLKDSISLNVVFPQNLAEWNDFDFVLVLDEDSGQPYTPFYRFLNRETKPFPFLADVVKAYNEVMGSLPYLEEQT